MSSFQHVDAYPHDGDMKKNNILFPLDRKITVGERRKTELRLGLVQIPVALDATFVGEIFWMCASANMAINVIEMTKLEINCNLIALQPNVIMNYETNKILTSPSFIVFHYYLEEVMDVAHYITTNSSQWHCIFFEDVFSNQQR